MYTEALHPLDSAVFNTLDAPELVNPPAIIEFNGHLFKCHLETTSTDTRRNSNQGIIDIHVTGGYGSATEVELETLLLSFALGSEGLSLYNLSLPSHGRSSPLPYGWGNTVDGETDFDRSAKITATLIKKVATAMNSQEKLVLSAWSMGGISVLKMTASHSDLVKGIVLIDTPVFPLNANKLIARFASYGILQPKREKLPSTQLRFRNSQVFLKRLREERQPHGIPVFNTVIPTVKSMAKQNLEEDGTLQIVAQSGIPILIIHGDNDFVIPKQQMLDLEICLRAHGGNVQRVEVEKMGHGLERPRFTGEKVLRPWLQKHQLLTTKDIENIPN